MSLTPGTKLGPYEVLAPLGAGGMGEVYKAKDTRLDRTVAIKVLPSHVANHPEVRQRFEREARAVSSLNHPHICTLYDIGSENGVDFMVMEHIEGQTLADRLNKGALPFDQALKYGSEIADALDKAHRQGVVHRDLKPGNIMLTKSGAKLLDFGLAKITAAETGAEGLSALPTEAKPLTQEGSILGTFQYMAPEQLEGKEADARTDIFAFGSVLYETVTGKRAFQGKSQASLIVAIMEKDPPAMSQLQPMTPSALDRTIKKCLSKEPDGRWQSASDLRDELKWIEERDSQASESKEAPNRWPVAGSVGIAAVALALFAGLIVGRFSRVAPDPNPRTTRFEVNLPEPLGVPPLMPAIALSPDGRNLAYVAGRSGSPKLYVRSLSELEAHPISGTEGATGPFFSTDGRWVGFFTQGKLKKVSLDGGSLVEVCDTPRLPYGGSWGPDDTIVFAWGNRGGLRRVSAVGGEPEVLTTLDSDQGETAHIWPTLLPGGRSILFTVRQAGESFEDARIASYSFETGKKKTVHQGGTFARYSPPDRLVFSRAATSVAGTLLTIPFDVERQEVAGSAVPILENVALLRYQGAVQFALSREGTLVYGPGSTPGRLVSIDRQGNVEPLSEERSPNASEFSGMEPRLSPDGRRLASVKDEEELAIWISELQRGTSSRLTFGGIETAPVWTPDGERITYKSSDNIYWTRADGSSEPEPLLIREAEQIPVSWSPNGEVLAFVQRTPAGSDIWMLRPGEEPQPFLERPFNEFTPTFSPDGRSLAYVSNESGRNEVYVRSFPGPGTKWTISSDGGTEPVWARDGRELFYRNNDIMMAVSVQTGNDISPGVPVALFEHRSPLSPPNVAEYTVTRDGRFIMLQGGGSRFALTRLNVILNWTALLEE